MKTILVTDEELKTILERREFLETQLIAAKSLATERQNELHKMDQKLSVIAHAIEKSYEHLAYALAKIRGEK